MALEVNTGTAYQDPSTYAMKVKTEVEVSHLPQPQITISEASTGDKGSNTSTERDAMVSERQLQEAVSKVNKNLKTQFTRAEFTYHKETKRVSIKVIDEATDEVIKEIPSEKTMEALEMIAKMVNMAGMFVDEKK
jgi:flagellar protein FlaG